MTTYRYVDHHYWDTPQMAEVVAPRLPVPLWELGEVTPEGTLGYGGRVTAPKVHDTCRVCQTPLGPNRRKHGLCQQCFFAEEHPRRMRLKAVAKSKFCKWQGFTDPYGPMPGKDKE